MKLPHNNNCNRLRVIVLGYIVRMPLGGLSWHYLQYVLGLSRLGHDVYYLEDSCFFEDDAYAFCYDPTTKTYNDPSYGLRYSTNTFNRLGLGDRWAFYDSKSSRWFGPCADRISNICATADLVINVGGANPLRPWLMDVPVRVYIDTDPVFSQIRQLTNIINRNLALQHTTFFSFGENIITNGSAIPKDVLPWQPTRQPVVLDAWQFVPGPEKERFSTIMGWESYKSLEYQGIRYGMKSDSFGAYIDLPEKAGHVIELALFDPSAAPEVLRRKGWVIRDAWEPTRDPWAYQHYIQQSKAEFSVAKHGYVISRCGWFSERSAAYLASGRPVLVQDTGFSDWLETGSGVVTFDTSDEAVAGIEEINSHYSYHCKAAREIVEAYFDAGSVLPKLIEAAFDPKQPNPESSWITSHS